MKRSDLSGQKFGRLFVEKFSHVDRCSYWDCRCDCGVSKKVSLANLTSGEVRSCGCLARERQSIAGKKSRKHGEAIALTSEYAIWKSMKARCSNRKLKSWKRYGAMGIKVCERWRSSFEDFLADMGRRPSSKHSIDRYPNPYGNYEPGNCRWATSIEQRHNWR